MPSLFSLQSPGTAFQLWFVIYLYVLPFLLYATWAILSMMAMSSSSASRPGWIAAVLLLPLIGGAAYLLTQAAPLRRSWRVAVVVAGLIVWLAPLVVGIWLAGGPLGPKALS